MIPRRILEETARDHPDSLAVPLLTLDEEGFSHVALLSLAELIAIEGRLYFYIGAASRSARRLSERGVCTLIFADTSGVAYLKGWPRFVAGARGQALFEVTPRSVDEDVPASDEGPVELVSGIRFSRQVPHARWALRRRMRELAVEESRRRSK